MSPEQENVIKCAIIGSCDNAADEGALLAEFDLLIERASRLGAADERIRALEETHRHHAERTRLAESRLEKVEKQNRHLRYWIRELREDGADAVSVDPLYGMLLDRVTELATTDPAADSPDGIRLTALAELCERYEKRRGESAVGIAVERRKQLPCTSCGTPMDVAINALEVICPSCNR